MTKFGYLWSYTTKKALCKYKTLDSFFIAPYADLGIWVISLSHKTKQENKKAGKNFKNQNSSKP